MTRSRWWRAAEYLGLVVDRRTQPRAFSRAWWWGLLPLLVVVLLSLLLVRFL